MIEMDVAGVVMDPTSNVPIVILKDKARKRTLPIWVGVMEASAIAMQLEGMRSEAPLPHEVIKSIIEAMRGRVLNVTVEGIQDGLFLGRIHIRSGRRSLSVDARASDAIALALRAGVPILVTEEVLLGAPAGQGLRTQEMARALQEMKQEDFGKYRL